MLSKSVLIPTLAVVLTGCGPSGDGGSATPPKSYSPIDALIRAARATDGVAQITPPDINEFKRAVEMQGQTKEGGGLVLSPNSSREKALAFGWNFFYPAYCTGWYVNGVFFLTMYMKDGSYIYSPEPGVIAALSSACTTAPAVGVNITNFSGQAAFWNYFVVYHI